MEKDLCNRDTDLSKFIAAVRGKNCLLRLRTIAFFLGGESHLGTLAIF